MSKITVGEHELRKWGVGYGGKLGHFMGRYVNLDPTGTMAIIERPEGGTRRDYLWHLSPTDLAYIQADCARLPKPMLPCTITGGDRPVLDLSLDALSEGPIDALANPAITGSHFVPINRPPIVECVDGRKGLRMDRKQAFFDMTFQLMALNQWAPASLGYRQPFTASAWVRPQDARAGTVLGWHAPTGDQGVSLGLGGNYIGGMGTPSSGLDMQALAGQWSHLTWQFTGGVKGLFSVYLNGERVMQTGFNTLIDGLSARDIGSDRATIQGRVSLAEASDAEVTLYIGPDDIRFFEQFRRRHWEQIVTLGRKPEGEFAFEVQKLAPATRYYYRLAVIENGKRIWSDDPVSFITADADGRGGESLPSEDARLLVLGAHWGGTWYFPDPPSSFFSGHMAQVKLYDHAISETQIAADAGVSASAVAAVPALPEITPTVPLDGETVNRTGAMRWKSAEVYVRHARLIVSASRREVEQGRGHAVDCGERPHCDLPITMLQPGETYYWRVETTFTDGRVNPGAIWHFTVRDTFEPEADGPVCEPFPDGMHVLDEGGRIMQGLGQVSLSGPGATNEDMFISTTSCDKLMHKRPDLVRVMEALSCGNQLETQRETGRYSSGFNLECYGVLCGVGEETNMVVHEFGHQFQDWVAACERPDFNVRLQAIYNTHRQDLVWLGDYAAYNPSEFMAVGVHAYSSADRREDLYRKDPAFYWLLSEFLSGDTVIDLNARDGVRCDAPGSITRWKNRGGLTEWVGGEGWGFRAGSQGEFVAVGRPQLSTVDRVAAVQCSGGDALVWNEKTQQALDTHRSWAVEVWLHPEPADSAKQRLVGWGSAEQGVALSLVEGLVVLTLQGREIQTGVTVTTDRWSHLCCNYQGGGVEAGAGELALWLDGEKRFSAMETLCLPQEQTVVVGGDVDADTVSSGYIGSLADLRIYDYAMGTLQIEQHYEGEQQVYRREPCVAGGQVVLDLDSRYVTDCPAGYHQPLYPQSLNKNWLRSWNNYGLAGGRIHNDVYAYLGSTSGSRPRLREVEGVLAVDFAGQDRMVSVFNQEVLQAGGLPWTLEAFVYCREASAEQTVLQWGELTLTTACLHAGWQHVVILRRDDAYALSVDGREQASISLQRMPIATERLHLGASYDGRRWRHYFDGAIACVRLHRGPLRAEALTRNAAELAMFRAEPQPQTPPHAALVALQAEGLPTGALERWDNGGVLGGVFQIGKSAEIRQPTIGSALGRQGVRLAGRKLLVSSFDTPEALEKGIFTLVYEFHQTMDWPDPVDRTIAGWGGLADAACLKVGALDQPGSLLQCAAGEVKWDEFWPGCHRWQQVTLRCDGRELRAWLDGQPVLTAPLPMPLPTGGRFFLGTLDPTGEGINDLLGRVRIYDRPLTDEQIGTFGGGSEPDVDGLIVDLCIPDGADGEAVPELVNHGSLGGVLGLLSDEGRAPQVMELDGRQAVLFDGVRNYLHSDWLLPACLSADAPFSVEIVARSEDVNQLRTLMTLAPYIDDDAGGRTTCRAVALSCGGTADPDTRSTCGYDQANNGGPGRLLGFTTGAKVREVYWQVEPDAILNRWVTFKWVYEGGRHTRVRLYIDGELNNEMCFARLDTPRGYPVWIGCGWNSDTGEKNLFKGAIASIRVEGNPGFVDGMTIRNDT